MYIIFNNKLFFSKWFENLKIEILSLLNMKLLKLKFLKSIIEINEIVTIEKKKIINIVLKFIDNLNVSFEARDVIYINKISIPPIKIKNKE